MPKRRKRRKKAERPPGKPGPDTLLTPSVGLQIAGLVGLGHSLAAAASVANVGRSTVYEWMERGLIGEEPYAGFRSDIEDARAGMQHALVTELLETIRCFDATPATRAANIRWLLERRCPKDWGTPQQQQRLSVKVGDSEATVVTTTTGPAPLSDEVILAMSPEQLQAFALAEVEALGEGMPQQDGANAPGEDDDG